MTIQETIAHLDELRAKATQGEWVFKKLSDEEPIKGGLERSYECAVAGEESTEFHDELFYPVPPIGRDVEYFISLANNYDFLRRAVLAGAELAEAVRKMDVAEKPGMGRYEEWGELPHELISGIENEIKSNRELAVQKANNLWRTQRDAALDTYKKSV